ncbi:MULTISPECIES: ATP-binding protein [unclassified Fusibacter]|uniref:ATP-binding protein n=1 Tax=unclassified Fusibacter TaxID=2624464 RepID=UPI0010124BEB|nr:MULTISPECIES: ATP-binding protein [unclassified Fusibacter]MCK8060840.1 ATP-binding protein [Fusibacter sp. A2]NPE23136.1 histidine kinase [Fusibacter sp. A1]RXV59494.1 histidine kinase [Fusibacter sp. A1]
MSEVVTIQLPSKAEYVSIARLTTSVIANNIGFDFEEIEDIKVAVGEACNNAVLHSNNEIECYTVNFHVNEKQFAVEIIDKGIGFDMKSYHEPDLEHPKVGGLGIFIMKSLMDEVEVKSSPQEGTAIKLIKHIV